MALDGQALSFTLTLNELDQALRYGLEFIGMGVLATAIQTLAFDNLTVYSLTNSDHVEFTYTHRTVTVVQGSH